MNKEKQIIPSAQIKRLCAVAHETPNLFRYSGPVGNERSLALAEYAELAYRHYSRESRKPNFADQFPPKRQRKATKTIAK